MKSPKRVWLSVQGSLLLICFSLVVGAGSNGGGLIARLAGKDVQAQSTEQPVVKVREGLKLEIITKQLPNDLLEVQIKNGYDKGITAMASCVIEPQLTSCSYGDYIYAEGEPYAEGKPGHIYTEGEAGRRVAPGVVIESFSLSSGEQSKRPLAISAVIFDDGTTDGERADALDILDKRLGEKIQLDRILPFLDSLKDAKGPLIPSELAKLRSIAESLPTEPGDGSPTSRGFQWGLRDGRADVLNYLSKLETALATEWVESWYENGTHRTINHSGEDHFRSYFPKVHNYLKALASRLRQGS